MGKQMDKLEYFLNNDADTIALGRAISEVCPLDITIYLIGTLGAGKTTTTRGFVCARGFDGVVKSPTYTLVEQYKFDSYSIYHFDLYRLNEPEELEMMGIRDYFSSDSIRIVEWPQNGEGYLPSCDLSIELLYQGVKRSACISSNSDKGAKIMQALSLNRELKVLI
jgi:tRNA threonylcarbamoyladenosine biosynthesis protein TsaE